MKTYNNVMEVDIVLDNEKNNDSSRHFAFVLETRSTILIIESNKRKNTNFVDKLLGFNNAYKGHVKYLLSEPRKNKKHLFYCLGIFLSDAALPPLLTVEELIDLYDNLIENSLYGRASNALLELIQGIPRKVLIERLSATQRQKLQLFLTFLNADAQLIILEEPILGMDKGMRLMLYKIIDERKKTGVSFIVVTKYEIGKEYAFDQTMYI